MPPKKSTTKNLPGTIGIGSMGGLVRLDDVTRPQGRIIPDATSQNSGVMTKQQAAQLATLVAGGGASAPRFDVVKTSANNTSVDYGQLLEVDATAGHLDVILPVASAVTPAGSNVFVIKNTGTTNTVGLLVHVTNGIDDGVETLAPGQFIVLVSDGVHTFVDIGNNLSMLTLTDLKVGAYNAQPNEYVQMDSTIGNISVTLPPAIDAGFGGQVWVKNKIDNVNTVTVLPSGADTIDGGLSALVGGLEFLRFVSDGVSDWMVS